MKKILMLAVLLGGMGFLASCSTTGGCCGYGLYNYPAGCGYSCTDNYQIIETSNPCPGPYRCGMGMPWV